MNVHFKYDAESALQAESVSVVGSFNQYDEKSGEMERQGNLWVKELSLPPGEYYYKFLIDSAVLLNDPLANTTLPNGGNELWTPLFIDEDGNRLYDNGTYSLNIDSYACGSEMALESADKRFCLRKDKQMIARFGFTAVKGLHCVTALWYAPDGQLRTVTDSSLAADETKPDKPVYLWFKNSLDEPGENYPAGRWTMKLLINGRYILEDNYTLTDETKHFSQAV